MSLVGKNISSFKTYIKQGAKFYGTRTNCEELKQQKKWLSSLREHMFVVNLRLDNACIDILNQIG